MSVDPTLIKWSFSVVERRAEQLGKYFYAHLFHHHPGVRAMFPERMDQQRDRLFAALTAAAMHVDDTDALVAYLRELGFDHRKFGARAEHYPAVGASLIATLAYFAGDAWTPGVESSWAAAYQIISQVMIAGAEGVPARTPLWWDAEVVRHERHHGGLALLTVRPRQPFPFVAGQYTTLTIPEVPQVWRAYSMANAPRADGTVDFHVRQVPGGQVSGARVERTGVGSVLRLGPALGRMRLPADPGRDLLFVAGGTGWAPVKALIEAALARPGRRSVRLLLGAASEADLYDAPALERMAAAGVKVDLAVEKPPQRRDARQSGSELMGALLRYGTRLNRLTSSGDWPETFVSGPPVMAETVTTQLETLLGVDPERIHADPPAGLSAPERPVRPADWFLAKRDIPWIRPRD